MRNKVVKQMLMFGMASMLAVSSPVVGWASEKETETENQEGLSLIHISEPTRP